MAARHHHGVVSLLDCARRQAGLCPGRAAGAIATLLAGLTLASCGSDPDADPSAGGEATGASTAASVTPEPDFAAAADSLCATAQSEQERIRRQRGGTQITLSDRARLLVELAPSRIRLGEQLAELAPPVGFEKQVDALVAAAERRGIASAEAGERWQRDAERERIAEAAAREHDERELFVSIARRLELNDCAEVLAKGAVRQVERLIRQAFTDPDPGQRCAAYGVRYLAQEYGGGVDACEAGGGPTRAGRVAIGGIEGMAGIFAVARATTVGGGGPQELRLRVTFEEGGYRIDKVD